VTSEQHVKANGLRFRVLEEGSGPPVVLLHGFPETADIWRGTMTALAGAGFRAIAPDLRGFGATDKPEGVESYLMPNQIADTTGLLDALGIDRAHMVGFDWGGALAWFTASFAAERVNRLVAVAVGHPGAFFPIEPEQMQRSWYIWLFQFRDVAEELLSRDDFAVLRHWLRWGGFPGDEDAVIARMAQPGALTAGVNWYRANVAPELLTAPQLPFPPVEAATLGIRGAKDPMLTERLMAESGKFVNGEWRYERFEDSGHWPMLDAPEQFNALLVEFLSG
jgi:pimeloyl-ACP methyl ester carboxylesterase